MNFAPLTVTVLIVVDRPMLDSTMITGGYDVTKVCVSHVTDMSNVLLMALAILTKILEAGM